MSWEKIENHLFDKYCVEGEDKELCNLQIEHDKEIRNQAITELEERLCKNGSIADFMKKYIREIAEKMKGGAT